MDQIGHVPIDLNGLASAHYTGAASELLAASFFLKHGYQVYWPAAQQSWVDFVIYKDEKFQRVQVKTAWWNRSSNHDYLQCRIRSTNKYQDIHPKDAFDLLVVIYEQDLWIIPSHELDSSNISLKGTCSSFKGTRWDKYKQTH